MAGVFLLALTVSPVFAARPEPLHIEVLEYPAGTGAPPEPFTASGLAVDNGTICATGLVADEELTYTEPTGSYQIIRVLKRFTCDDGSGSFDLRMVVRLDLNTNDTAARWRIVSGTGDYAGLRGRGSLIGLSQDPDPGILDIYDGRVH